MKDIFVKGREMVIISPGEKYSMPDDIANQLIARGKADEVLPTRPNIEPKVSEAPVESEKKSKKGGKE